MKASLIVKPAYFLFGIVFVIGIGLLFLRQWNLTSNMEKITPVKRMDLVQHITFTGNVEPEKKSIITAPYDGYVRKIYVQIGDKVRQNAPLVSVTESLQSSDRVYPLRAPFSGTVMDVLKQEGEFVQKNNIENYLVRIDQIDTLYVEFDIPELYRLDIQLGQKVIIKIPTIPNKQYHGVVDRISLAAKQQSVWRNTTNVEFSSRVKILDMDHRIKSGLSAFLDIVNVKKKQVLLIPRAYVFKKDQDYFVVLQNNIQRQIQVGEQNEEYFEVLNGLKEGDKVKQIDFIDLLNAT